MPEISRFYGIIVRMFFRDHDPPHFHIEYQEYEAIIEIRSRLVKGEMPERALKMVFDWLDIHENELIENWKLARRHKPLNKIAPLY